MLLEVPLHENNWVWDGWKLYAIDLSPHSLCALRAEPWKLRARLQLHLGDITHCATIRLPTCKEIFFHNFFGVHVKFREDESSRNRLVSARPKSVSGVAVATLPIAIGTKSKFIDRTMISTRFPSRQMFERWSILLLWLVCASISIWRVELCKWPRPDHWHCSADGQHQSC